VIELALLIGAGILAGIDELQAGGKSLLGWAVILVVIALLYGRL
jgi:hypothetical protein